MQCLFYTDVVCTYSLDQSHTTSHTKRARLFLVSRCNDRSLDMQCADHPAAGQKKSVCCAVLHTYCETEIPSRLHSSIHHVCTYVLCRQYVQEKSNDGFPPIRYKVTIRTRTDDTVIYFLVCQTVWHLASSVFVFGSTLWYVRNRG